VHSFSVVGDKFVVNSRPPSNGSRPVAAWKDRRHRDDIPEGNQGCPKSRRLMIYYYTEADSKTNADEFPAGRLLATLQRSFRESTRSRVDYFRSIFEHFFSRNHLSPALLLVLGNDPGETAAGARFLRNDSFFLSDAKTTMYVYGSHVHIVAPLGQSFFPFFFLFFFIRRAHACDIAVCTANDSPVKTNNMIVSGGRGEMVDRKEPETTRGEQTASRQIGKQKDIM
jgi:hypothetical protein